jgi:polar amino acid transport system substrate-binding protein
MTRKLAIALATLAVLTAACASISDAPEVAVEEPATTTQAPLPPTDECENDAAEPGDGRAAVASYPPSLDGGPAVDEIRERGVLRAGVSTDTLLFGFVDPLTQRTEGFDIEMVRLVARALFPDTPADRIDERIELVGIPYAQRIPLLLADRIDIVAHTMTINCSRWQLIAFSGEYFTSAQQPLVRAEDEDDIEISAGDLAGLGERRVCVAAGGTSEDNLEQQKEDFGHQYEVVPLPDITDCLVLFQRGEVDVLISDDTVMAGFAVQDPQAVVLDAQLTTEPYGLGMQADAVDFVQFVNAVLEDAKADGSWESLFVEQIEGQLGNRPPPEGVYTRPVP